MTGRYASRIRCYDNAAPLSNDVPALAHYLTHVGYECLASGKLHYVGPDQLHGFRRRLTSDVYPASFEWAASRIYEDRVAAGRARHARSNVAPKFGYGPHTSAEERTLYSVIADRMQACLLCQFELDEIERDVRDSLTQRKLIRLAMDRNGTDWAYRTRRD